MSQYFSIFWIIDCSKIHVLAPWNPNIGNICRPNTRLIIKLLNQVRTLCIQDFSNWLTVFFLASPIDSLIPLINAIIALHRHQFFVSVRRFLYVYSHRHDHWIPKFLWPLLESTDSLVLVYLERGAANYNLLFINLVTDVMYKASMPKNSSMFSQELGRQNCSQCLTFCFSDLRSHLVWSKCGHGWPCHFRRNGADNDLRRLVINVDYARFQYPF